MMNKRLMLALPAILLLFSRVNGQTESEIKTTGKYLYSWAIEKNEYKAREEAIRGLLDTIGIYLSKELKEGTTDTVFNKVIDYFTKKVGLKWQVIAFAEKSEIEVIFEPPEQVNAPDINTGNTVLDELVKIRDARSLEQKLIELKAELKVNFGSKVNYPNDSGCYIFIIDGKTNQITAILDKGTGNRKNLLSGESENIQGNKFIESHFVYVVIN